MNLSVLHYLVSPASHQPLEVERSEASKSASDSVQEGNLKSKSGDEAFPIVEGVPLLQPVGHLADWDSEVLEVLFGQRLAEVSETFDEKMLEERTLRLKSLTTELGVDGVREAFNRYAKLPPSQRLDSLVRISPAEQSSVCPMVSRAAIEDGREYATMAGGKRRAEQMREMVHKWASHIPDYVSSILESKPAAIVELATGAGLGTNALLEAGLGDGRLISLDIDYACVKNAEGLAKYHGLQDRTDPVVANFWFLPFRDDSIDMVCAHYGLDDSREVPRVIEEVSRVLAAGGRFVNVSRCDPTRRLAPWLGDFGFDESELKQMVSAARLYPGPDGLADVASQNGLALEDSQTATPESSHERVILVFRKTSGSSQ